MIMAYNTFYAILFMSFEAMIPLISDHETDLIAINSFRLLVGSCSKIAAVFVALIIFNMVVQTSSLFLYLSIITSSVLLSTSVLVVLLLEEDEVPSTKQSTLNEGVTSDSSTSSRLVHALVSQFSLFKNSQFLILALMTVLFWCQYEISSAVLPIYIVKYLKISIFPQAIFPVFETSFLVALLILVFCNAIAQIALTLLADRLSKSINTIFQFSLLILMLVKIGYAFMFELMHISSVLVYVMCAIEGFAHGIAYPTLETMVSDFVFNDQHENHTGEMRNTIIYGWFDSIRAIAMASGALIDAFGVSHFNLNSENKGLFLIVSGVVPSFMCLLLILVNWYKPINRTRPGEETKNEENKVKNGEYELLNNEKAVKEDKVANVNEMEDIQSDH